MVITESFQKKEQIAPFLLMGISLESMLLIHRHNVALVLGFCLRDFRYSVEAMAQYSMHVRLNAMRQNRD